jgi:hypothetical protein
MSMNVKTKLFSLIILAVLVLPVFINPPKSGSVLGVLEKKGSVAEAQPETTQESTSSLGSILLNQQAESTSNVQEKSTNKVVKDISSGIRDIKKKIASPKEYRGKIVWDANAKYPAISDKFGLGTGVRVVNGGNSANIVVGDVRVLSPDTLMVVDNKTFTQLGGNLEKDLSIDVVAIVE